MLVDFYQLGATPAEEVIASLAEKLLSQDQRLLVVAEDAGLLSRLDRLLWDDKPTGFIPHALAGGPDDARQPVLLASTADAPNLARNILIADGQWRDAALNFDRTFHLFDSTTVAAARQAWKSLADREGVERRYWKQEPGGRWGQQA